MIFLAGTLSLAGQPELALPLARRALAMNPLPPPYVQRFYGATMWANGLLDEALTALDGCLQAAPKHSACRLDRTIARAEAGRIDEALADLAEWQSNVGPQLKPEVAANAAYSAKAQALKERRLAALKVLQAQALAVVKP